MAYIELAFVDLRLDGRALTAYKHRKWEKRIEGLELLIEQTKRQDKLSDDDAEQLSEALKELRGDLQTEHEVAR